MNLTTFNAEFSIIDKTPNMLYLESFDRDRDKKHPCSVGGDGAILSCVRRMKDNQGKPHAKWHD